MFAKFLLGRIRIEDKAKEILGRTPLDLIARHAVLDHGQVSKAQLQNNLNSLATGGEISSAFFVDPGNPKAGQITITTEAGWGGTLVSYVKTPMRRARVKGQDDFPI